MLQTPRFQVPGCVSLVLAISALFATTPVLAANNQCIKAEVNNRPKIGLVLGGGGARGYAHVGVLKKLEIGRAHV